MKSHHQDLLTNLPSRIVLDELKQKFSRRSKKEIWTVVMIDVDHFKLVNDIYGHLTGDEILKEVAIILSGSLRKTDLVLRYGGDEFLGILFDTNLERGLNFSGRVMEEVSRSVFPYSLQISLSMGLSESTDADRDLTDVIKRADEALYEAKDSGRGRISFFKEKEQQLTDESLIFTHFIGRQPELRKLRQLLDEAASGSARFAMVTGEPGVGKTRLVQELYHYSRYKNISVLTASCDMLGGKEPYSMIVAPMREALERMPEKELTAICSKLPLLHPATHAFFPMLPVEASDKSEFYREERLKYRVFEDILAIFHSLCQITPWIFFIDDLQWISQPDWELYAYMMRGSLKQPVLFLATCRKTSEQNFHWSGQLGSLKQLIPFLMIPLMNLTQQEQHNLVMFAFRDPNVPGEMLDALYHQSGGNPFFTREMIKTMFEQGSISRNESGEWNYHTPVLIDLPESLTALISSRLEPLDQETRKLLRIAALASGSFPLALLCHVVEKPELEIAECLERPLKMGIIRETTMSRSGAEYAFMHDTVRSYLLRELSSNVRSLYHARLAEFCESRYNTGEDEYIVPMAYHYGQSNKAERAMEACLLAARHCERRQANRETIQWLAKFVTYPAHEKLPPADLVYAYRTLGKLNMLAGHGTEGGNYLAKALSLAIDPEQKAHIISLMGSNMQRMSRYPESRKYYLEAIGLAQSQLKRADFMTSVAFLDILEGNTDDAAVHLNESERMIETAEGDPHLRESVQAAYFTIRGILAEEIEPGTTSLAWYERALEIFRKYADTNGEAAVLNNICEIHSRKGNYEEALNVLQQAEMIATRLDDALLLAINHFNMAEVYTDLNQPAVAAEYYDRYIRTNDRIGNALGNGYARLGQGSLFHLQGKTVQAEKSFREARDIFRQLGAKNMIAASTLKLAALLSQVQKNQEAEDEMASIDPSEIQTYGAPLYCEYNFTKAVLLFRINKNKNDWKKSKRLLDQILSMQDQLDLHQIMESYFFLTLISMDYQSREKTCKIIREALKVLRNRLSPLKNSRYRASIRKRGVIALLINLASEYGIEVPE